MPDSRPLIPEGDTDSERPACFKIAPTVRRSSFTDFGTHGYCRSYGCSRRGRRATCVAQRPLGTISSSRCQTTRACTRREARRIACANYFFTDEFRAGGIEILGMPF